MGGNYVPGMGDIEWPDFDEWLAGINWYAHLESVNQAERAQLERNKQ